MRVQAIALISCLLAAGTPVLGADAVSYAPAPTWVKAVTVPKDDGRQADAPAKLLLRNYQLRFTASSVETYVESYIVMQTPQGLQALGNIELPWKPDTDVLTVHKCQLLRGDRVIDILDSGQKFEVLRRENNLEYAALDGILSAVLQPAGMEVGDVLNLAFSVKRESSLLSTPETVLADFSAGPMARVELRAQWDRSIPVRWRASPDVKGIKEARSGKEMELNWVAENLEPINQPNNVPARFWRFPMIEFTGYADWNAVSRALAPLYAKAAELQAGSALKAEARAIAAASTDTEERLEKTLKLVQDRVRYVFLGMGDGNLNPAPADLTWQRRFGDCKGKSALLIALLRELGIEAEPVAVTVTGGDALPDRLPMMGAFNHVIVRAQANGRSYWLDGAGTGSWRRADMAVPNYHWGLPATVRGEALLRMQAEPAAQPHLVTSIVIDARAGIHVDAPFKVDTRIRGAGGAMLYGQLSQLAPAGRDQALRSYWQKEYDFVEVKTVGLEFEEATGSVVLRMEGAADMDWGGDEYITDGMRVGAFVDYARDPGVNADAPFVIEHPAYRVSRQRIELPPVGTFVTKGAEYDVALAGSHYKRQSKLVDRVFSGEVSVRSLASEVGAKEARAAQKQLNDMWKDRLEINVSDYAITDADFATLRTRKFTDRANLVWRGNFFLDRSDYDAAFADFDAAVKADAKSASALAHRGLAHYWKQRTREAKADFEAALALDPESAVAHRGMGAMQKDRWELPAAVESFTRSLRAEPNNTFALTYRAYSYGLLDKEDLALADAAAVIKLQPTYPDMYDLRAWIFTARGDRDLALAELKAMLAASPDNPRAYSLASYNYSRLGLYAEAVQAMDRVIAGQATAANYQKRAQVRDPTDFAGRLADIDAAIALEPGSVHLALQRAQLYSETGNHKGAVEVYTRRLAKESDFTQKRRLHTLRAIEYQKLGDAAAARKDLTAALSDGADGDSYNNYCWHLAAARLELESALAACEKAVSFAPKDASYLDSRGFVLLQLGRLDEAMASYDQALALKPKLPASLYGRGLAKKRRCQCAEGDEDIRAGALGDPSIRRTFSLAGLSP
jgi:tetratricopeptide (TPR) repeat protein